MPPNADIPEKKTGFARLIAATGYSFQGLCHALQHEAAFRQEALLTILSTVAIAFLPVGLSLRLAVVLANLVVLITELLNSAMEALVDRVSPEFDPLAKQAKDMGSAAVLIAFVAWAVAWVFALSVAFWGGP